MADHSDLYPRERRLAVVADNERNARADGGDAEAVTARDADV